MPISKEQIAVQIRPLKPPRGLFKRIIDRLGLEKQLQLVKHNLGFFSVLSAVFVVLCIFAYIGLKAVLAESSFGKYLQLLLSDPDVVLRYWKIYLYTLFESLPAFYLSLFLIPLALIIIFASYVSRNIEKVLLLTKSIRKQKYGRK